MRVLAVVGPTAVGKTPLAAALAARLGDAELVNADSRQVIRGLEVGTSAPRPDELRGVPCHLLGVRAPGAQYSVAEYAAAARAALDDLAARGRTAVVVGGTGLYLAAALDGLALRGGPPDPATRARREAIAGGHGGTARLASELRRRDPEGAASVDLCNPRRVVRALELVDALGSLAAARRRHPARTAIWVGLDAPPALHAELVEARARRMFESGDLLAEVDSALSDGVSPTALDAAGIGYREALAVRAGRIDVDQAIALTTRRTLRYAKAQRTWFRRDPRIRWWQRGPAPVESLVAGVLTGITDALHQDARVGQRLPRH
ncbi:MAG TPA: tRNA (adenosine(37)-N6)-dimethylallyltransferase MiaA [Candidatus Dormibacteraeota bacterium]